MTMDHDASGRSDGSHGGSNAGANPPFDDDATPLPPEPVRRQPRALMAFVGLAVVVLVAGLAVWVSSGGADDEVTSASVPPSPTVGTTVPGSVATPSTAAATAPPTTAPPTTPSTMPASTAPPTTAPPTTAPPAFTLPEPGAETWTVPSDYAPVAPEMTLDLATTSGEVRVYDGVVDQLRCVGVVGPGDAVTTWCGPPNLATSFVADRGLEPVVVELGAAAGSATVQVPQVGWTLGSNGCSDPLATILGGVDPGALPVTGVICRGDEAFLGIGASFFGPGIAPDGGGILAARRDEGWVVLDFGTSIDCAGGPDGADRCARFEVDSELFAALLPVPPVAVVGLTSIDVVGVTDRTAEVEAWIDGATDPDEIEVLVTEQLLDPQSELPAYVRRSEALQSGRVRLMIVEIPQQDDSIATETWAIWTGLQEETAGVTAFSWAACARSVTGEGLCV